MTTTTSVTKNVAFNVLIGLTALLVLLQGVTAGIFLEHDGARDAAESWLNLHARGGDLAVVLALAATVVALIKLRPRRDLWIASGALAVVLLVERPIGSLIADEHQDALTAVHVPLGLAVMGLVVWISVRSARGFGR